jgi:hypothetical protein
LKKIHTTVLFAVPLLTLLIVRINSDFAEVVNYGGSGTYVGGIIWKNTTWTAENSPYFITETVQIPENVTLTIEPGVTVIRPRPGDMFLLHGGIEAHGTVGKEIIIDGGDNSNFFNPKKTVATTFLNLSYCVIQNGLSLWPPQATNNMVPST